MSEDNRHWGKYRATVLQNEDPMRRGRITVECTDVLSLLPTSWCEPCVPWSGPPGVPMGMFVLPAIGASVWVEFEHGDADRPIWTGCRWSMPTEIPQMGQIPNPPSPPVVIQTLLQNMVIISDMPPTPLTGGIILRSTAGAMIVVNDSGIFISNGKGALITMIGTVIDFNMGALTVLK